MKILNELDYKQLIKEYSVPLSDQPAIFVADYASYNEGHISGAWFDLADFADYEDFMNSIKEFFLKLDKVAPLDFFIPREEMMFQDWQSIPDHFIGESSLDPELWEYLDALRKDDGFEDIYEAFIGATGQHAPPAEILNRLMVNLNSFDNGSHLSPEEKYGYFMKESGCIEIPPSCEPYFDFEMYGAEMLAVTSYCNGFVFN